MRLSAQALETKLARESKDLPPVYLVSGDEPLLIEEACACVRLRARAHGYERSLYVVESGFDWNALFAEVFSPSLFSPRSLYEVRLPTGKPGETGAAILAQLVQRPPANTLLLVVTPKLDKGTQQAKWVQALDAAGVWVNVWPLEGAALPGWIAARLKARGVQALPGVAERLAYYTEGNLLAAAQEIDKLALLYGEQRVGPDDIADTLSDNSRFNVFSLADTCLEGDAVAALHRLSRLRTEGVEPILVLWALTREVRELAGMSGAAGAAKTWPQRQARLLKALRRGSPRYWRHCLAHCAHIDKVAKGRAPGDAWVELERLALAITGVRLRKRA